MMDFESFNKKYNKQFIEDVRKSRECASNNIGYQTDFFINDVIEKCEGKVFDNDYPLAIDNPYSFMHVYEFNTRDRNYSRLPYKKETMFKAVEEMNKNGWKIKIKKNCGLFDLIDDLRAHFKNRTLATFTYKLVIYNN